MNTKKNAQTHTQTQPYTNSNLLISFLKFPKLVNRAKEKKMIFFKKIENYEAFFSPNQ